MRSRELRRVHAFAAVSAVLSLVVRLWWVFRVQSPYQAVYSDMNGYVERALALVAGTSTSYPRLTALYPYGAHYLYAAAFRVFGYQNHTPIEVLQAVATALPAYFYVLFAARFFRRAWVPGVLGAVFAIWQPILWCTGFFLSEIPYIALLYLNAWQCLRFVETKRGGIGLGITGAILFAVRPQFILTFALLAAAHLWSTRALPRQRRIASYARVVAPWVVVLAFSIGRYHHLTGNWGLISENGQLNRLFADTTVGRVEGHWRAANGDPWMFAVEPPAKPAMREHDLLSLPGYIGDPVLLATARKQRIAGQSLWARTYRAFDNVRLLWDKNDPWPEQGRPLTGLRRWSQIEFNQAFRWVVLPLSVFGLVLLRKRTALVVVIAHLLTLVGLSMFFLAEARYRVPYDPFLILIAVAGIFRAGQLLGRRFGKVARLTRRFSRPPQIEPPPRP